MSRPNRDDDVIAGFGDEWSRFDQSALSEAEREEIFNSYFAVFPWDELTSNAVGADFGCGSGRWAAIAAPRVGRLYCIDPSDAALDVARYTLNEENNVVFVEAGVDALPGEIDDLDFGYSLGVLHHIPDTEAAMRSCVDRLRVGAPFLVYLYYAFDNRPRWFRLLWRASDYLRRGVSRLPYSLRFAISQVIAVMVYWPLARVAKVASRFGVAVDSFPLSFYRDRSLYVMRTDALDRFGTRLEQRFSREQISRMMSNCGLTGVIFHDHAPYWCAVGWKA